MAGSHTVRKAGGSVRAAACLAVFAGFVSNAAPAVADITNTAIATATYASAPVQSAPATAAVQVAPPVEALSVDKRAYDAGGTEIVPPTKVSVGQIITYKYVVTNTGNRTISNVKLNDVQNGSDPDPAPGSETLTTDAGTLNDSKDPSGSNGVWDTLAPGDSVTFSATYTVTQQDVDQLQ